MIQATYIDHMGSDLSVVNAARVSFGKKSDWDTAPADHSEGVYSNGYPKKPYKKLKQGDKRLIQYLALHKHISPFGHAFASFHVKAPVFVARQLVKHKFLRWNEVSRRYVDDEPEFMQETIWRGRSEDKKQGSSDHTDFDWKVMRDATADIERASLAVYKMMIAAKVAPEQARMVLPASLITEWYWSGSLDAFASMCHLRCKPDTQEETREVAEQISQKMLELFPISWEALMGEE